MQLLKGRGQMESGPGHHHRDEPPPTTHTLPPPPPPPPPQAGARVFSISLGARSGGSPDAGMLAMATKVRNAGGLLVAAAGNGEGGVRLGGGRARTQGAFLSCSCRRGPPPQERVSLHCRRRQTRRVSLRRPPLPSPPLPSPPPLLHRRVFLRRPRQPRHVALPRGAVPPYLGLRQRAYGCAPRPLFPALSTGVYCFSTGVY